MHLKLIYWHTSNFNTRMHYCIIKILINYAFMSGDLVCCNSLQCCSYPISGPLPWLVVLKFQMILMLYISESISVAPITYLFLNWLFGPSVQTLRKWTFSDIFTTVLSCLRLSLIITCKKESDLNQATEVYSVIWACFQFADWTSSCAVQALFSAKSICSVIVLGV